MIKSITLFISLLLVQAGTFEDPKNEILNLLKNRDQQIKMIVSDDSLTESTRERLKVLVNEVIDFKEMSKFALQETYEEISDTQRNEFIDLFSSIVRDQSLKELSIYRADIEYGSISFSGDTALVATQASIDNVSTPVSYKMLEKDDRWVVIDMSIDDVSTALSYRRSFQRVIAKKGFESLLNSLRKRAQRNS